jgi:hypothetical protein
LAIAAKPEIWIVREKRVAQLQIVCENIETVILELGSPYKDLTALTKSVSFRQGQNVRD